MKILKGLTLVTTVVLALAAQGSAAGSVTTSNVFVGPKTDEPGVSSGLVLKKGHGVSVSATGNMCPFGGTFCVGPDGYASFDTTQSAFGGFVLPGAPAWGLVGRVGSGPWVQVGDGPTTLSGKGELVFAVNDDLFGDNTGDGFMVTVSYRESGVSRTCWPGWGYGDENHEHCGPPGLANKPEQGSSNEHGKSEQEHGKSGEDEHGNGNPKK